MKRHSKSAFTLVEMLVVLAVIGALAGLVISAFVGVQRNGNHKRALTEIQAISTACENYKNEFGSYPQNEDSDALDPRAHGNPLDTNYLRASLFLYKTLSGDLNANGRADDFIGTQLATSYFADGFRPNMLAWNSARTEVLFIKDPYGNCYGYSTAALAQEKDFQFQIRQNESTQRPKDSARKGYNPTFDLWSTGGKIPRASSGSSFDQGPWVKSWQ